jgi:hypothetical protein
MRIQAIPAPATVVALLALPAGTSAAVSSPANAVTPAAAFHASKYDKYCKGQRNRRVGGHSDYSRCLSAMRRLDSGRARTARGACRGLSKRKLRGRRSTPYKRCLRGASRLRADNRRQGDDS